MTRILSLALLSLACSPALAQHAGHGTAAAAAHEGVHEAFDVSGLRVDDASPPPGSAVGRAGLRFEDGGYVSVVYGKPYARGRMVFGGLVGFGQVWVTGAHRATELVTTVPLQVGQTRIEPGAYSLFTTPGPDRWTIHLNRRLGMHLADEYDPSEDIAVVEVRPETTAETTEALTLTFDTDETLALRIAWDQTAVRLPIVRLAP